MEQKKEKSTSPPPDPSRGLNTYAKYSTIAFTMTACILAGVFGGKKLDRWLEMTYPVFTITLTLLSFAFSLYYLFKGISRK